LEKEEAFWQQRSKEQWLLYGDNNTSYFHKIANGSKRKRTMFSLKKGSKNIQGTPALLEHATNFYKNLFGPVHDTGVRLRDDTWGENEKLSEEDRINLDRSFSEQEIYDTICQMEKNKAAGPDGIPVEFYQHCWGIIKIDLMQMFNDFHEHAISLERINYGIITLIPKGEDADIIQKYRPICLLQVLFKIFTKTMTARAEPIMGKLIHPCQNAFIRGRYITDGVMLLQEILRESKYKKTQGVVLKIDFEKAYDKVNWNFLLDCCRQKGFSDKWIIWIKEAISKGTLSVKINDVLGPYFGSFKGVRQGDPFAPFLFNMAANGLSKMIENAQRNGLFKGLAENLVEHGIAILQYADDTILLIQDDLSVEPET
jgi:hypothetical protein